MGEIVKVLETARAWIGAKEGTKKYDEIISVFESNGKYKYDGQGCCEFVCAVFIKALGITKAKKLIPVINYAEAQAKMWKDGLSRIPQVGSLIYFSTGMTGKIDHVELVAGVTSGTIKTIDGNYGHTVVAREWSKNSKMIIGYGTPAFTEDKEFWEMEWKNAVIDTVQIKRYNTGALVLWLQQYLQAHGYYLDGYTDGVFGAYTETCVKKWQKDNGLQADGIIGKYCFTYMVK